MLGRILAGIAILCAGCGAQAQSRRPTTEVAAPAGRYVGMDGAVRSFRGIRFARPPEGPLRWRPPQALPVRRGTIDATRFGDDCMQTPDPVSRAPGVSEDCLTLNVWAPQAVAGRRLPVMVWIYGGGFTGGSGSLPLYDGTRIAGQGVVLVTLNYRVGVFGFLAHPGLSAESPHRSSGNYGLMDQLAALRWVKANIAAFGGDPANVTVFAQSAGASSLSHLIVSQQSTGLFAKAILESPGAMRPLATLAEAERTGLSLDKDIAALRRMSAGDLLALNARIVPSVRMLTAPRALGPIIDGWVVRSGEASAYAARSVHPIPLIVGGTADEGRLFVAQWPIRTVADYDAYLARNFGRQAGDAAIFYPAANDARVRPALSDLFSDTQYHYGIRGIARGMADAGQRVWRYQFTHVAGGSDQPPTHADELPFVFGNPNALAHPTQDDRAISQMLMSAWLSFARTGDPNGDGVPPWPRYDRAGEAYLEVGQSQAVPRRGYRTAQLDFIERYYELRP